MKRRLSYDKHISLGSLSFLNLIVIALLLYFGVTGLNDLTQESVEEASQLMLDASSSNVEDAVHEFLWSCQTVAKNLQDELRLKTLRPADFENEFFTLLHQRPRISDTTFTSAHLKKSSWPVETVPESVRQLTVSRDSEGRLVTRELRPSGARKWELRERTRGAEQAWSDTPTWEPLAGEFPDPSQHPSFQYAARHYFQGDDRPTWSDLTYCERDGSLPESQRRVEVTLQCAITDNDHGFLGVVRVGLLTRELDHCFDSLNELSARGEHYYFICDNLGRFITPVLSGGTPAESSIVSTGGRLRVQTGPLPLAVKRALEELPLSRSIVVEGEVQPFLARLRNLNLKGAAQRWRVGLVVAEKGLVGTLPQRRRQLIYWALAMALVGATSVFVLMEGLRKQLSRLARSAQAMKQFQFEPRSHPTWLTEVSHVAESMETAKGTLRAMVCYVPVELVRQLFQARLKPVLSSTPETVCLMFTDIVGFTTTAELLTPDQLATCLGAYLECMNDCIQRNHGTLLERVGDALLSIWNAPNPTPQGELWACRAALECSHAIQRLPDSAYLATRFGIHRDRVLVGHFGSRDRMNYGVLGDGVNFASRLEGLNKHYQTSILISSTVVDSLGEGALEFVLRRLDLVTVKGKQLGVLLYELVGAKDSVTAPRIQVLQAYEAAWDLYQQRHFREASEALAILAETDGPSQVLRDRCHTWEANPPEPDWDGSYHASEK